MTRKRFIKLLMSQGKPRNEAVKIAQSVTETGYSYQRVYDGLFVTPVWDSLIDFLHRMADAFMELGKAAVIRVETLAQAISEAFPIDVEEVPDIIAPGEGEEKI